MKTFLKDRFGEAGATIWYSLLVVLALVIIVGGGYFVEATAWPWWLSVQRQAQGQSKSFVDSNNKAISMYTTDYEALTTKIAEENASTNPNQDLLGAYKGQQSAIMAKICQTAGQMVLGTVDNYNVQFINSHGGCR